MYMRVWHHRTPGQVKRTTFSSFFPAMMGVLEVELVSLGPQGLCPLCHSSL